MLKYKTGQTWFSHLLWHLARKRSRFILTTSRPRLARGRSDVNHVPHHPQTSCFVTVWSWNL